MPLDEHGEPLDPARLSQSYEVTNKAGQKKKARIVKADQPASPNAAPSVPAPPTDEEILELNPKTGKRRPPAPPAARKRTPTTRPNSQRQPAPPAEKPDKGEDEFWGLGE